ncbi:MAG: ATP-binding protein [Candidatus Diapherotrites archaeon]|nr:ATP-binding protein [Candidatus Diapherotrites archaeon]
MLIEILKEWNPWWEKAELIREIEGTPRPYYDDLIDSIAIREITIITGIRRSGKSTLMYQMVNGLLTNGVPPEQILFVNLEDKKLINSGLDDIYDSYRTSLNPDKKAYIFLDEVHRKKDWEMWIRKKYDLKTNNKFVISGSSSYLLKKEYSSLLTGRNLTFDVFPLSFKEYLLFANLSVDQAKLKKGIILDRTKLVILKYLETYLNQGGFPEIFFKQEKYKTQVLEQYFDDILYKDIIDRYNLNSQKAKDLALFLMTNFTGIISLRNLRNSLGMSYDTIKDYMSYCKEAFLFFTLDHFSYSFKEQKTLASKTYCIDNGLRNAVCFKFSKDKGKLAENHVFIELKRRKKNLHYWKNNGEVDFIIKNTDQSLTAINVTYTDRINDREIKALLEFKKKFSKTKELILLTRDTEKNEQGIRFIPLYKWLLA